MPKLAAWLAATLRVPRLPYELVVGGPCEGNPPAEPALAPPNIALYAPDNGCPYPPGIPPNRGCPAALAPAPPPASVLGQYAPKRLAASSRLEVSAVDGADFSERSHDADLSPFSLSIAPY